MKASLLILAVLSLLDVLTTAIGLSAGASEANPLAAFALGTWGQGVVFALKGSVMAGWVAMAWRARHRWGVRRVVGMGNVWMGLVVTNNLVQLALIALAA